MDDVVLELTEDGGGGTIEEAKVVLSDSERIALLLGSILGEGRHPSSIAATLCVLTGELLELQGVPATMEDQAEMARWRDIGRTIMRGALAGHYAAIKEGLH